MRIHHIIWWICRLPIFITQSHFTTLWLSIMNAVRRPSNPYASTSWSKVLSRVFALWQNGQWTSWEHGSWLVLHKPLIDLMAIVTHLLEISNSRTSYTAAIGSLNTNGNMHIIMQQSSVINPLISTAATIKSPCGTSTLAFQTLQTNSEIDRNPPPGAKLACR